MPHANGERSIQFPKTNAWSQSIPWTATGPTPQQKRGSGANVDSSNKPARPHALRGPTHGRALSVFKSPTINQFDVEILADVPEAGIAGSALILGRASGPIIDELGGVPAGASGSPVFVNDRLIGAIALTFGDPTLVGITPIGEMRKLAEGQVSSLGAKSASSSTSTSATKPISLPVAVGFRTSASLRRLEEHYRLRFNPSHGLAKGDDFVRASSALAPGSAVGAALLSGDLRLGFIGTTTEIEEDQLLAFGHPLLFTGPTQLALTKATILVTGREGPRSSSEKIGDFGETIGTVLQDRSAGIFARIGPQPELIPLQLCVTDKDRSVTERMSVKAAPLAGELSFLTFAATVEALTRAMDRVGQGTAAWTWRITVAQVGQPVELETCAFNRLNIADVVASSIFPLLDPLLERGLDVREIRLTASVEMERTLN